jgi:MFS family permease
MGLPSWLFMIYAGVVADRMSRRTLLIMTQTCMMLLAFILAALTFTHLVQPWHILALAFFLGIANAFDAPTRQSFVLELVQREDLTNAIALNSAMFNSATAVGPAASGVAYALVGPGWCFTINAVTFLAIIWALWLMEIGPRTVSLQRKSVLFDLKEGFHYVTSQPTVRTLISLTAIMGAFGFSFIPLFPAWAVNVLGGNETTNGLLQSARGIGALAGALGVASVARFNIKGRLLTIGTFVFPIMLLIFSTIRWIPLSLFTLLGVGAALLLVINLTNALIQTLVPDQLRGRVMGIYMFTFFGFMPVGGLLAGAFADRLGAPFTLRLCALVVLGFTGILWVFAPKLRTLE